MGKSQPQVGNLSPFCIKLKVRRGEDQMIFFPGDQDANNWYKKILEQQKFEKPISQYRQLETINSGSFSNVLLGEHVFSKQKVVIKKVDKKKAWETFRKHGSTYQEVELMERVCRGQVPNMIQLIETFTDNENFNLIVEHHPDGDLMHYFLKVQDKGHFSENAVQKITQQLAQALQGLH